MHCNLIWAVAVASIGSGFQHGYNTGVVNPPQEVLKEWIRKVEGDKSNVTLYWSFVVAIFCIGGMVGGAFVGLVANSFGRKGGLIFNNLFVLIAAVLIIVSQLVDIVPLLIAGRFVIGINCGLNAGLAPMYLSEISPTNIRGAIGSTYQLMITISILISQVLGVQNIMGTSTLWPYLFALILAPGLYQIFGFICAPESPKYYLDSKQDDQKATRALLKLAGEADAANLFAEMKKEVDASKALPKVTVVDLIKQKRLRRPLIILCVLMIAQQLSGINAVMFYSTHIFTMAKFSEDSSQYSTLGVGAINVITTVISVYLVEKFGRKSLLLFGFGGMFVSTVLLFVSLYFVEEFVWAGYVAVVLVYLFVIFFASGAGSIPWLLGPELFSTSARPPALSIAVPTNWIFNFIVGIIFLPLQELMGAAVFIIFIICQILAFIFILVFAPETKNKPIEEITALFE